MKSFLKDFKNLIFDLKFILPLFFVTLFGFGYTLDHFSIGIDDLTRPRYIGGGENIAQGRFSGTVIDYVFGFTDYTPFWEDLVAVIFMFIAGILAALFLKRVTKNTLHRGVYTFFACFFVSFPLINEIFLYAGTGLNIAIGYCLSFLSFIIFERFFETKKYVLLIPYISIWIFNTSLYESFIFVYVCAVCGVFFIRHMIAEGHLPCEDNTVKSDFKKRQTAKKIFTEIGWHIAILVIAIVFEFIISNMVMKLSGIAPSDNANNLIKAFNFKNTFFNLFTNFFTAGFKYLPITVFIVAAVIGLILSIRYTIKEKHGFYLLYLAGMMFSIVIFSFMRSGLTLYRNIQCMVIVCGMILVIILQKALNTKIRWKKITTLLVSTLLILCQTVSLIKWFHVDYLQSEEEKAVMIAVGEELTKNYDISSKPVLFIEGYTFSDEIMNYKYIQKDTVTYKILFEISQIVLNIEEGEEIVFPAGQVQHDSVISWGVYAFGEVNTELLRYFEYLGYDFIQGTYEQNEQAIEIAKTMSPEKSWFEILDTEEFIVVKFG